MVSITVNDRRSKGGGFLLVIAILLMITGWAMESTDYDVALGALLFTIGFWLFAIPIILIGIGLAIILVIAVFASR